MPTSAGVVTMYAMWKGAVGQASRDLVFRYQLVLAIEDAAVSFADRFDAVMQLAIERLYGEPTEQP